MTKFVFTGNPTGKYSGGVGFPRLYDDTTAISTTIPVGTDALDFTGNGNGTGIGDGVFGGSGNDTLTGVDGNNVFHGGAGDDTITGGKGNDRLNGGLGINVIDGGDGADTASFDFSDQTTNVVAVNGGAAGTAYAFTVDGKAYGSVKDVEILSAIAGGTGNDRLGSVYTLNGSVSYSITGGGGNDVAVIDPFSV